MSVLKFHMEQKPSKGYLSGSTLEEFKNEIIQQLIMIASRNYELKDLALAQRSTKPLIDGYKSCVNCEFLNYVYESWKDGVVSIYDNYCYDEEFESLAEDSLRYAYKELDRISILIASPKEGLLNDDHEGLYDCISDIVRSSLDSFSEQIYDYFRYTWCHEHKDLIIPQKELTIQDLTQKND